MMSIEAVVLFKLLRFFVMIPPALENSLSAGTDVAGIIKCFIATLARIGKETLPSFAHHLSGSVWRSMQGLARYRLISTSNVLFVVAAWVVEDAISVSSAAQIDDVFFCNNAIYIEIRIEMSMEDFQYLGWLVFVVS